MSTPGDAGTDASRRAEVFRKIFDTNYWKGEQSVSGTGSDPTQTDVIRTEVPALLTRIGARSMLDAPCGDFAWLRDVDLPVERYIGADIVPPLVDRLRAGFATAQRSFIVADLVQDTLPAVDLILCRDCLVHLPYVDITRAVENFRASGATWLLTTTFPGRSANRDIRVGRWRPLDLQAAPFHWPVPDDVILEKCTESDGRYPDKSLALWRIANLPRPVRPSLVGRIARRLGLAR